MHTLRCRFTHQNIAHLPTYKSVDSGGIDRLSFPIMTLSSIGHEVYMLEFWGQNILMLLLVLVQFTCLQNP